MLATDAIYQTFNLFGAPAPGSNGIAPAETPTLQPFLVPNAKANAPTVIVCPGGGYAAHAPHEGEPVARWLNSLGIHAFVLRYRVKPHLHPIPSNDAKRAIRFVRHHAPSWNLDPARIGILGFSAGGHLAATASVHYDAGNPEAADPIDRASSRPAVQILIYPVISIKQVVYQPSFNNLLGDEQNALKLADIVSAELNVNAKTPPAFIFHSTRDTVVPVRHSDLYIEALKKHNVPCACIRGEFGEHGIGLNECWCPAAAKFLREQGF